MAPHHKHYASGISDILTLDETVKRNPQAVVQLCLGAFRAGMREFTANVAGNDLVRVTGYMVRLSDLEPTGKRICSQVVNTPRMMAAMMISMVMTAFQGACSTSLSQSRI